MTTMFVDAIREALGEELRRDPTVFLIGEDIGAYGGAFKTTAGLLDEFGPERVIETPIAEAAIIGAACGAAMCGMRPVAELQFIDFLSCGGFDQLVTVAAKSFYRNGVPCPIVVRGPSGGGGRGGPFHSACPEMWAVATPGIKVVFPSTAYDAKGLLKASIRDQNPVLFLEHKFLYRRIKEELPPPEDDYIVPLGQGIVRREGSAATILTYGAMTHTSLEAATKVAALGKEVRVVDLRTLVPLDIALVVRSVQETNRILIVHEHPGRGGFAGELAALINELAFDYLDAPILRVTAPQTPVPYAPTLEDAYLPQVADVVEALDQLLRY